jgi:hypothetical protein
VATDYPRGYFHGTKADLRVGDSVLPRALHGNTPTTAPVTDPSGPLRLPDADDYAYVTTNYRLAWVHAHYSGPEGEPRVCRVQPERPVERDAEYNDSNGAYRCPSAVVLEVYDEPAVTAAQAAAGWKQPTDPLAARPSFVVLGPSAQG